MNVDKRLDDSQAHMHKASECIKDAGNEVKKQAQEYSDEVIEYIQKCPVKSVAIAVAIGLLIGKLFI